MPAARSNPAIVEGVGNRVVDGVHQANAVAERGESLPREPQRLLVAVDADEHEVGKAAEEGLGVATEAERRVDEYRAGLGRAPGRAARPCGREVPGCGE